MVRGADECEIESRNLGREEASDFPSGGGQGGSGKGALSRGGQKKGWLIARGWKGQLKSARSALEFGDTRDVCRISPLRSSALRAISAVF